MLIKKVIIITLIIAVLCLSGCMGDMGGTEITKNSFDNLVLLDGAKLLGHSSDYLSGADDRYMVSYQIKHNGSVSWVHGFVYDSENDELMHHSNDGARKLPEYIKIKN